MKKNISMTQLLKGINLEQLINTAEDEILTADNLVFCNRHNIFVFNSTRIILHKILFTCQSNTKAGINCEIFCMPSTVIIFIRRHIETLIVHYSCLYTSF